MPNRPRVNSETKEKCMSARIRNKDKGMMREIYLTNTTQKGDCSKNFVSSVTDLTRCKQASILERSDSGAYSSVQFLPRLT